MSKYTTEVRYICEQKAGLTDSQGADSIDDIISKSWNKIFTTNVSFFDNSYRAPLCRKILKHYYLREIGAETVGIWIFWLNTKLEEIMPYYNQLYKSATLDFNPFYDVDLSRTHTRSGKTDTEEKRGEEINTKQDTTTTNNSTSNTVNTNNDTGWNLFSDTPQGAVTGIENESYLTNATKTTDDNTFTSDNNIQDNGSTNSEGNTKTNETKEGNINTLEEYIEKVSGKQGTTSYSKMLTEYRETMLNIDMMVINEFEDLFFGLW